MRPNPLFLIESTLPYLETCVYMSQTDSHLQDGQTARELFAEGNGLIYADYLILPGKMIGDANAIHLKSQLSRHIELNVPFVSSPMDTVTESGLAIALALAGGIGVIHYSNTPSEQAAMVKKVKRYRNGFIFDPIVLSPDHRIEDLDLIKKKHGFSGVPVTENGKKDSRLLGIVTGRDVDFEKDRNKKISQVMTRNIITGNKDLSLEDAYELLKESKKGKLPIVNENFHLIGLISRSDLTKLSNFPMATMDKAENLRVGAAVSASNESSRERAQLLADAGVDVFVIDSSQGFSDRQLDMIRWLKTSFPNIDVIAGNIVTREQAQNLIHAGCDGLRVGMGPGSICITQDVLALGRAQATAVYSVAEIASKKNIPVIADGGIQSIGDIFKSLCIGANTTMMGAIFAGTRESPGEYFFDQGIRVKKYRGMASKEALEAGGNMRYYSGNQSQKISFSQGVSGTVADKGSIFNLVPYLEHGLRLSCQSCGFHGIADMHKKMRQGELRMERRTLGAQKQGSVHGLLSHQEPFAASKD